MAIVTPPNWPWKGSPLRNRSTLLGRERWDWTSAPPPLPSCPVPGEARLGTFCAALDPRIATKRRLQRKLDRQRRANNPQNYDEQGRCKQGLKTWHDSQGYQATRRRVAHQERKLAAQRKSLHGQLVHEIVAAGDTIITEQISYRGGPRQFGRSVGLRAPGMFLAILVSHRCKYGRHPGRSSHPAHQAVALLPRVWRLRQEVARGALAKVALWDWAGAA